MKFNSCPRIDRERQRSAFTLIEVLAALLFMAIVIPVAIEGLRVASSAGVVAQRKAVAARIGSRVLDEMVATAQTQNQAQSGTVLDAAVPYKWSMKSQPWIGDLQNAMRLVTVEVTYPVPGREEGLPSVKVSTLTGISTQ